jgi:hypothetical protein
VRSSVKFPHAANDNLRHDLIKRTQQTWQPRLGQNLSCEEARQIIENVSGFFAVLADWSRSERAIPANDNESAGGSSISTIEDTALSAGGGAPDHG